MQMKLELEQQLRKKGTQKRILKISQDNKRKP